MKRLLVSACLLGQPVRYDGDSNQQKVSHLLRWLTLWQEEGRLTPICPESLGGLPTPRPAAEIFHGTGVDVLQHKSRVITQINEDVTSLFINGAHKTLTIAQNHQATAALLAAKSPSCGVGTIYNGEFSGTLTEGDGVTTALLKSHGIACFSPDDADALIAYMQQSKS